MPVSQFVFGLWENSILVGAISFGPPASPQIARSVVIEEYQNLVLELNRLVIITSTKNAASFLIGQALHLLPTPRLIVSYADGGQGHNGYVYQATNFMFAGPATAHDSEYIVDGKKVHSRTLASRGISDPKRWARENHVAMVKPARKNRYVLALGTRREKKLLYASVKWPLSFDYPKEESLRYDAPNQFRAGEVSGLTRNVTNVQGRVESSDSAPFSTGRKT
jgi:hypothetical protein